MIPETHLPYNDKVSFKFCNLYLNDKYLINVVNEGELITWDMLKDFNDFIKKYYRDNEFVYISHRLYSYTIDPNLYREAVKTYNVTALAVVSRNFRTIENANVEKLFFEKQFKVFNHLSDAIEWSNALIS